MFKVNIDPLGNYVDNFAKLRYLRNETWQTYEEARDAVMNAVRKQNPQVTIYNELDDSLVMGEFEIDLYIEDGSDDYTCRSVGFFVLNMKYD